MPPETDVKTVAPNGDTLIEMPSITRVELIDYRLGGGIYSNWTAREVSISVQDDARTLKVFVKGTTDEQEPARLRNRAAELIRQAEMLEGGKTLKRLLESFDPEKHRHELMLDDSPVGTETGAETDRGYPGEDIARL